MRLSKHNPNNNNKMVKIEMGEWNNNNNKTELGMKEIKKLTFTADVELVDGHKKPPRQKNSWAEIYHNNTIRRKSLKLLGGDLVIDDSLDWRVKWGQRGVGIFGFLGLIFFILAGGTNVGLRIATIIFITIALIFAVILYYKNASLVIVKRLLKETNVVVIVTLTAINWAIEIERPSAPLSPLNGLIYMLAMNAFVFIDAMKLKSRIFVIIIGSLCTILNINNIYNNTFENWNKGVVLFNYTIQGEEYTIMKRSIQRSIFLQVLLFSISAVYTMFKDKKMELMIFATGNIYRETGTASKEIEDKTFSMMIQRERTRSMDQSNQQSSSMKKDIKSNVEEPNTNVLDKYVQNPLYDTDKL